MLTRIPICSVNNCAGRISNPQHEYFSSDTYDYHIMEVTLTEFICTMKAVTTIKSPPEEATLINPLDIFHVPVNTVQIIDQTPVPVPA